MSTRRTFLKQLSATGVLLPFIPGRLLAREGRPGANGGIRIGVIGTGGRARQLMEQLPPPGKIVALADCYQQRMVETLNQFQADWPTYQDYRQMLDREQLDAIIVGTPDHARTLPCIPRCASGAGCVRREAAYGLCARRPRAGRRRP